MQTKNRQETKKLQLLRQVNGLEFILLKFFKDLRDLTAYDNNNHPDIIWNDIKNKVDELEKELWG